MRLYTRTFTYIYSKNSQQSYINVRIHSCQTFITHIMYIYTTYHFSSIMTTIHKRTDICIFIRYNIEHSTAAHMELYSDRELQYHHHYYYYHLLIIRTLSCYMYIYDIYTILHIAIHIIIIIIIINKLHKHQKLSSHI